MYCTYIWWSIGAGFYCMGADKTLQINYDPFLINDWFLLLYLCVQSLLTCFIGTVLKVYLKGKGRYRPVHLVEPDRSGLKWMYKL